MRRVWHITRLLVPAVFLLAGGAAAYLAWFGGIERLANNQIRALFAEKNNLEVRIGEIGGDLFDGFTLSDVQIYYVDSQHRYLMADIPRLTAVYSFSNLWNRRYILDDLHVDSLGLTLRYESPSGWLLPPLTSTDDKPAAAPPYFSLSDVAVDRASMTIIRDEDTSRFTGISLGAAVAGDQGTYAVDLHRLTFASDIEGIALDAATGKITLAAKRALFQNVALASGPTRVRFDGNVVFADTVAGTIDFDADNVDIADVGRFIGKTNLYGNVDLNGSASFVGPALEGTVAVAGDFMFAVFNNLTVDYRFQDRMLTIDSCHGSIFDDCMINGAGGINFATSPYSYFLNAELTNFNLHRMLGHTFPSDLTGSVALVGESFRKEELKLELDVDLHHSSFDDYPIHSGAGHMTITTDSLVFADSFRVDYFENVFWASGRIDYHDDIDLALQVELHNLDRYRGGKIFIDQPGGRGYAEATLTGKTVDPDLRGWFVSDSVWIYGLFADTLFGTVDLERFLTGRMGAVAVDFGGGAAWDIPYDTGFAELTIDSNLVFVDSCLIFSEFSKLTGHAVLDYMVYPQEVRVGDLKLDLLGQTFVNQSEMLIDVDTLGFIFNRAAIGNDEALVSIIGRVDYDESMDFLLAVDRLPIAPWLIQFDSTLAVDGYISCEAAVKGTFMSPEFRLYGGIDSLTYTDLVLGDLVSSVRYRDRVLMIDSVYVYSDPGRYRAAGSLYVDLAFTTDQIDRFPQESMSIRISATDQRFDLVSLVMPTVEQLDGYFWADFQLFGTPEEPHVEGEAYIKNARLKYFDLEHPLYADSAGVTMQDNRIMIEGIELYATNNFKRNGRRHRAEVEGEISLLQLDSLYYDLGVILDNEFPFIYELEDFRGKVEGELSVVGPTPPLVTGELTLVSAQYRVPFADEGTGSPLMLALATENPWNLDIDVEILSNYWVKNEDVDAEFAGSLNLIREQGNYRFIGEMEILRGRGFLFDKTFRLDQGSLVTFEGNDTLNPRLDITGSTRVSMVRAAEEETPTSEQFEDLCIHVTGTLDVPEINPCEGSNFSRSDMLPLIVANYYTGDGVSSSGQIENRIFGLGYAQMSQIGGRQLGKIGVETFEIDPVYGEAFDPWNARVTVGFYTGPRLYLYGRSTLSGQTQQEVGFEYRLNKAFLFEGRRDEDELYHLNLRLHWEF